MKKSRRGRVLILEQDGNALKVLAAILEQEGFAVISADRMEKGLEILGRAKVDAVVAGAGFAGFEDAALVQFLVGRYAEVPLITLTVCGSVREAVRAMAAGAFYYLVNPDDLSLLGQVLDQAVARPRTPVGGSAAPEACPTLREMEARAVRQALQKASGNKSQAARLLGVSRKALYKRLREAAWS